ncbi:MAG: sigma-70 family RNA polymerase sigma factor, partial [Clostridia bacterium]|nr:sigma-70 family RNA polymerase sigma factor [Clostridia bacterium]
MYYNKVEICGVNTSELKVLSDAEKKDLLKKTKQGDREARAALICGNLRLVLSIIQRFINRRENMDDLFQVGCIGLVKAVDNFNIELDVKFSTYAVPMIIGEIRRYLRDNSTIRISRSVRDLAYRALQAREEWIREKQTEPDVSQLAEVLGEKKEAV